MHRALPSVLAPLGLLLVLAGCPTQPAPVPDPPAGTVLAIAPGALPLAAHGRPYEAPLTATGGEEGARRWFVAGGALPPGLAVHDTAAAQGRLAGTPTLPGRWPFVLGVEDAAGQRATRALEVVVEATLRIDAEALPEALGGAPFHATLRVSGGSGLGYRWSLRAGALPPGVLLQDGGASAVLAGTPTPGEFRFTLAVEDSDGVSSERALVLRVRSPLSVSGRLAPAAPGSPVEAALEVEGGVAPYRWTVVDGGLPASVVLTVDGRLEGSPGTSGRFPFRVRVEDALGTQAEEALELVVVEPLGFDADDLPAGLRAVAYAATLRATGGVGDRTWSVAPDTLPPGLTFTAAGDVAHIAGTPSRAGASVLTVTLRDAAGTSVSRPVRLEVASNPPLILTTDLAEATVGQPYWVTLASTSAVAGTERWQLASGELPAGLTLGDTGRASATLSGTPRVAGTFPLTLRLEDEGEAGSVQLVLRVVQPAALELRAAQLPPTKVGRPYRALLRAVHGSDAVAAWSVEEGALPPGLALQAQGGEGATLSGTPREAGFYRFVVRATTATGQQATRSYALLVAPPRHWVTATHSHTSGGAEEVTVVDLNDTSGRTRWTVASGLGAAEQAFVGLLEYSPDGAFLSFEVTGESGPPTYVVDLRKPEPVALREPRPGLFSPDGRWAVRGVGDNRFAHDMSGDGPGPSLLINSEPVQGPGVWSADARRFVTFSASRRSLLVWEPDTGARQVALAASFESVGWPVHVAPHGQGVVLSARETLSSLHRLYYVDLSSTRSLPVPLTPPGLDYGEHHVRLSPDGAWLAFASSSPDGTDEAVYVVDLGRDTVARARRVSGSQPGPFPVVVEWSPDSRRLLFAREGAGGFLGQDGLFVADALAPEGTEPLAVAPSGLGPPTDWVHWAPGGEQLAYPSREGFSLVRVVGVPRVERLLERGLVDTTYAFAPGEARRLVYQDREGLFLLELDAPPEVRRPLRLDTAGRLQYWRPGAFRRSGDVFYYDLEGSPLDLWWVDLQGAVPGAPLSLVDFSGGLVDLASY